MRFLVLLIFPGLLSAQLIPAGQPVPKSANPPVVFLDGYQAGCTGSDFASNFGAADKLLQANSIVTLYFDNCTVAAPSGSTKPDIETVGAAFGKFLGALKYTDGTPVTQVDVVAHSMGGLVLRSYLSGIQDTTPVAFNPPAVPGIRRIVFLATPHFGTTLAALLGVDIQTHEMAPASQFLLALNTWNQGTDDLRGISAISVSGNGGTGEESLIPGFDDGVVALTSSSLGFYQPGRTRIVPDCHTTDSLLVLAGFCSSSTPALNMITNDTSNPVSNIIVSFLSGTSAWQTIGQAAESNSILSVTAGINVQVRDQSDNALQISGTNVATASSPVSLKLNGTAAAYFEALPSAVPVSLLLSPVGGQQQSTKSVTSEVH
jgi:pimeloyl-ACP methyl ester carboxylesterase